jgi:hypothetical protein
LQETPRKRLEDTINHRDPGKVVVDFGGTSQTGIHANALAALRDALGLEKRAIKVIEPFQLLGMIDDDLIEALELCVVKVSTDSTIFGYENKNWKPWKLPTGLDVLVGGGFVTTVDDKDGYTYIYPRGNKDFPPSAKLPPNGYFFDNCFRTFKEFVEENSNGAEDYAEDYNVYSDEKLKILEDKCNHLYSNTDLGLIGGGGLLAPGDFGHIPGPGIPYPKGIRDIENFICAHVTHPDYIHQIFGYQTEIALKNAKLCKQVYGDRIQVIHVSTTDFGTQRGPIMSKEMFREFYKPYYKQITDWIHQNTNWKTFFHTCGSVLDLLQDFYEMGVDILNPVQCSAEGMDPKLLKEKWGGRFTFWGGGVNTQKTLPFGTPEEVYKEVSERLSIFAPGGGYVFSAIHNIQGPTPVANMLAMFNAVKDYNKKLGF